MIKIIEPIEIEPLKRVAKLNGCCFNKSTNVYFGCYIDNILVGFVGLMELKNKKAVLKNAFVLKDYRGNGIYTQLNKIRMNYIKEKNFELIEANVTTKSIGLHLKNGAKIIKQYNSCAKIIYIL